MIPEHEHNPLICPKIGCDAYTAGASGNPGQPPTVSEPTRPARPAADSHRPATPGPSATSSRDLGRQAFNDTTPSAGQSRPASSRSATSAAGAGTNGGTGRPDEGPRTPGTAGQKAAAAAAGKIADNTDPNSKLGQAAKAVHDAGGSKEAVKDAAKKKAAQTALRTAGNAVAPGVYEAAKKTNDALNKSALGRKALRGAEKITPKPARKLLKTAGFGAKDNPTGKNNPTGKKDGKGNLDGTAKSSATAKKASIGIGGTLAAALAVILIIVTTGGAAEWNQEYALAGKQGTEVPDSLLDVYKKAADDASVPWTVLAALGKVQTDHGALSPYDTKNYGKAINRDPDRVDIDASDTTNDGKASDVVVGGGNPQGAKIVEFALQYLGTPYVFGANEPGGFDCSGLTQYAYDHFGISLPHKAAIQGTMGVAVPVDPAQLQPGDLVFWGGATTARHVGMYIGSGKFLHAPRTGDVVKITELKHYRPDFARRILGTKDAKSSTPTTGANLTEGLTAAGPTHDYITPAVPNAIDVYGARPLVAGIYADAGLRADGTPLAAGNDGDCYDDDPDAKVSIAPCTVPAIGTGDDEGHGIFLTLPTAPDLGDTDLQNVEESADYMARQLAAVRAQLEKAEGKSANDLNQKDSDAFWGKAVAMLPIASAQGETTGCGIPTNVDGTASPNEEVIVAVFRCELEQVTKLHVADTAVKAANGAVTFTELDQNAAVDELVDNALTVAWGYSQWGDTKCDNKATHAGVFPLTKEQATANALDDRCDDPKNIAVAAKLIAAGEQTAIATRSNTAGPYAPMLGGWATIAGATGNTATTANFAKNGPPADWTMTEACATQLETWAELMTVKTGSPFNGLTTDAITAMTPEARTALDTAYQQTPDPAANTVCAGASPTQILEAKKDALDAQRQELGEGDHEDTEPATGTATVPFETVSANIDGLTAYLQHLTTQATEGTDDGTDVTWGKQSSIARLSTTGDGLYTPTAPQPINITNTGVDGKLIIEYAIYYGGIVHGDPRAGTAPSSLTDVNTGTGGTVTLGIVVERLVQTQLSLWPSGAEIANLSNCGAASNASHRVRVAMAPLWNKMCEDAKNAGVKIAVNSSLRTKADQQRLYNQYGPGRAARPGRSNHERGVALDVSQAGKTNAWMHNIVGCYNPAGQTYTPYSTEIPYRPYADALASKKDTVNDLRGKAQKLCGTGQDVIKRIQTYGLIFAVCAPPSEMSTPAGIRCEGNWPSGQMRENWHVEMGKEIKVSAPAGNSGTVGDFDAAACGQQVTVDVNNPYSIQKATYVTFRCMAKKAGFDSKPATAYANGNGPQVFANYGEQVAAEAVVIGYCESSYSKKNATSNNPWGFGGVFQMSDSLTRAYIPGGNKFDVPNHLIGAAKFFIQEDKKKRQAHGGKFGGWWPWAPVNTSYGGANDAVKVPVLPRFASTQSGYVGLRNPGPLPNWALDPMKHQVTGGCSKAFQGKPFTNAS
jgi:hypothetical protein